MGLAPYPLAKKKIADGLKTKGNESGRPFIGGTSLPAILFFLAYNLISACHAMPRYSFEGRRQTNFEGGFASFRMSQVLSKSKMRWLSLSPAAALD